MISVWAVIRRIYLAGRRASDTARMLPLRWALRELGTGSLVRAGTRISTPRKVSIGENVFINVGCMLNGEGGLSVGSDTQIGPYTTIWTSNHRFDRIDVAIRLQGDSLAPVTIGRDVWIGASVTVLPGVAIGDGAVIGAGAVVTSDVGPGMLALGVPAREVRSRARLTSP